MKRRWVGLFLAIIMAAGMYQPAFAAASNDAKKTKTVWVIDSVQTKNSQYLDFIHEKTVSYNKKGLISKVSGPVGFTNYTYDKKNRLTSSKEYIHEELVATNKFTYSGMKVKKRVSKIDGSKTTTKYTWKSSNKTIVMKSTSDNEDGIGDRTVTLTLDKNKRIKKYSGKMRESEDYWTYEAHKYAYDKNGFIKKCSWSLSDETTEQKGVENYKCKLKKDKKGNISKISYKVTSEDKSYKEVYTFHYKKITVAAKDYDLILLQQKSLLLLGCMPELEMLTE